MPKRSQLLEITSSYPVVIGDGDGAQTITCRAFVERISAQDAEWPKFAAREFELSMRVADKNREINALYQSLAQPKEPEESVTVQFTKAVQANIDAMMLAKDAGEGLDEALLTASTELGDFQAKQITTAEENEARYREIVEQMKGKRDELAAFEAQVTEIMADRLVYLLSPHSGWDVTEDDDTMTPITRANVMTFSMRAIGDMLQGAVGKALGRPEQSSTS